MGHYVLQVMLLSGRKVNSARNPDDHQKEQGQPENLSTKTTKKTKKQGH